MQKSLKILLSPLFLLSLFLLLINDFFLKDYFHNFLTGKFSDFAGLFVFSLFWTAFFPKWKPLIFSFVIVFFAFWKSPFSSGFIHVWNSIRLFEIARTIDYTDLTAFSILPLAWIYIENHAPLRLPRVSQNFALITIAFVSLFAFTATSQPKPDSYRSAEYSEIYRIEKSPIEILKKLQEYETDEFSESKGINRGSITVGLNFKENFCDNKPYAIFEILDGKNPVQIKLTNISYECKEISPEHKDKLKIIFEKEVLDFLKN